MTRRTRSKDAPSLGLYGQDARSPRAEGVRALAGASGVPCGPLNRRPVEGLPVRPSGDVERVPEGGAFSGWRAVLSAAGSARIASDVQRSRDEWERLEREAGLDLDDGDLPADHDARVRRRVRLMNADGVAGEVMRGRWRRMRADRRSEDIRARRRASLKPRSEASDLDDVPLECAANTVIEPGEACICLGCEVSPKGCGCWFCPGCCKPKGMDIRSRLIERLSLGSKWQMWTLTVDPNCFTSPREAFEHVHDKRKVARFVRELRKLNGERGVCHRRRKRFQGAGLFGQEGSSHRGPVDARGDEPADGWESYEGSLVRLAKGHDDCPWFCVFECQKNGWPHWHLLVPAEFCDYLTARRIWGLGIVRFSDARGKSRAWRNPVHAARYVSKYLIKSPEGGWPDWVMAMGERRRLRRYSTSRGFWIGGETERAGEPETVREMDPQTYRVRVESCGETANVFLAGVGLDGAERMRWLGEIPVGHWEMPALGVSRDPDKPDAHRRAIGGATSPGAVLAAVSEAVGRDVDWLRGGRAPPVM